MTQNEIRIANATCRTNGASAKNADGSIRAVVPKYVAQYGHGSILDFGAGKEAIHTKWLRGKGMNVTAHEFGCNQNDNHDKNALKRKYDITFASNVLNVQSNRDMLHETLAQIAGATKEGGRCILNYPQTPRKCNISSMDMKKEVENAFGGKAIRLNADKNAPVWMVERRV